MPIQIERKLEYDQNFVHYIDEASVVAIVSAILTKNFKNYVNIIKLNDIPTDLTVRANLGYNKSVALGIVRFAIYLANHQDVTPTQIWNSEMFELVDKIDASAPACSIGSLTNQANVVGLYLAEFCRAEIEAIKLEFSKDDLFVELDKIQECFLEEIKQYNHGLGKLLHYWKIASLTKALENLNDLKSSVKQTLEVIAQDDEAINLIISRLLEGQILPQDNLDFKATWLHRAKRIAPINALYEALREINEE